VETLSPRGLTSFLWRTGENLQAGFDLPGELFERNVVESDTENYRLIDFHDEDVDHTCGWNKDARIGEVEPNPVGWGVLFIARH